MSVNFTEQTASSYINTIREILLEGLQALGCSITHACDVDGDLLFWDEREDRHYIVQFDEDKDPQFVRLSFWFWSIDDAAEREQAVRCCEAVTGVGKMVKLYVLPHEKEKVCISIELLLPVALDETGLPDSSASRPLLQTSLSRGLLIRYLNQLRTAANEFSRRMRELRPASSQPRWLN